MKEQIRTVVKKAIPKFFRYHLKNKYRNLKTIKARKVFEQADDQPVWLGKEMLGHLQKKYPYPSQVSYDPRSLKKNGEERTKRIIELIGRKADQTKTFLELGCNDGMVCYSLRCRGEISIGIDLRSRFDERALSGGCLFIKMDASQLGIRDGSVDFVYSFASFEHFNDPKLVLEEAIRVVKTGGYIYLHYGPLYMSHYGLHAYRSITVPYCQFLFPEEVLVNFCVENKLKPPDFSSVNKWSLEDYRELWDKYSPKLRRTKYYEYINADYVELITRYPFCFKSKTRYFNNLIVPEIEVLFQKIA